jgi:hypothetical protein
MNRTFSRIVSPAVKSAGFFSLGPGLLEFFHYTPIVLTSTDDITSTTKPKNELANPESTAKIIRAKAAWFPGDPAPRHPWDGPWMRKQG